MKGSGYLLLSYRLGYSILPSGTKFRMHYCIYTFTYTDQYSMGIFLRAIHRLLKSARLQKSDLGLKDSICQTDVNNTVFQVAATDNIRNPLAVPQTNDPIFCQVVT